MDFLVLALALVLGLCVGSFLNVLITRLPDPTRSLFRPIRSACPLCSAPIRARDNIPLISYILLRGHCRACRAPISWRYPLVELAGGLIAAFALWRWGSHLEALRAAVFMWILVAVAVTDMRTYLIPDHFTIGGATLGLPLTLWTRGWTTTLHFFADALTVAFLLWALGWAVGRASGREALGFGDVLLVGMIASYLGFGLALIAIYLAAVSGLVHAFVCRSSNRIIPFGPHLAVGGIIALLFPLETYAHFLSQLLPWH